MSISYKFITFTRTVEPDSDGYYRVPIADRYHHELTELKKTKGPSFTLSTILCDIGMVYSYRPPNQEFEYWRLPKLAINENAAALPPQIQEVLKDGAARFNLVGDTFGGKPT